MHYVKIPPAIDGLGVDKDNAPVALPFASFLAQFAWNDAIWRKDNGAVESFLRTTGAIAQAEAGTVVELLDADFERLELVVREAHARFQPTVVVPLMRFVHAVTGASSERPST